MYSDEITCKSAESITKMDVIIKGVFLHYLSFVYITMFALPIIRAKSVFSLPSFWGMPPQSPRTKC